MKNILRVGLATVLVILFSGCARHAAQPGALPDNFSLKSSAAAVLVDKDHTITVNDQQLQALAAQQQISSRQALVNILLQSSDKKLQPDPAFNKVRQLVSSGETEVFYAYADVLSRYLTSETFACREPSYYRYFNARYHREDHDYRCAGDIPFNVVSQHGAKVRWLNPKRVSEIHLLFAGKGKGLMSKFGHVSLRLIVCPEHNVDQEVCDQNLYQHIVLGYRAHVDDFTIDAMKGVFGDYRAYLYANEFMDIYREYAIEEFREVYSLPLKLNQGQREELLRGLSEISWSYAGDYKFFTSNCSTLLQLALRSLWPEFSKNLQMNTLYWRPDNFFAALRTSELSDFNALEDLSAAEKKGFYFSSTEPIYNKALRVVAAAMQDPQFKTLDEYVNQNPVERYENALQDALYYQHLKQDVYLHGAQVLLEEFSVLQFQARTRSEMSNFFDKNKIADIERHMLSVLGRDEFNAFSACILKPVKAAVQPHKTTVGIPERAEIAANKESVFLCDSKENAVYLKKIGLELENIDPVSWKPIKKFMLSAMVGMHNVEQFLTLAPSKDEVVE